MKIKPNHEVNDFTVKLLIASLLAEILIVILHYSIFFVRDIETLGYAYSNFFFTKGVLKIISNSTISIGRSSFFFFLSGYLLFKGLEKKGVYKRKIFSRIKSLGIPYVVWNVLASPWITAVLLPVFVLFMPWLGTAREVSFQDVFLGSSPQYYPANAPLWFLRELFLVSLLSPILLRIIKSIGIWWVILTFFLWTISNVFLIGGIEGFSQGLCGFSLGGYCCYKERDIFNIPLRVTFVALTLLVILTIIQFVYNIPLYKIIGIGSLIGIVIILGLSDFLSKTRMAYFLAWMGEASFFIYLIHIIGRGEISKLIISLMKPQTDFTAFLTLVAIWVFVMIYTVGLWALLRRFAPRLLNIMLGGRVRKHFSISLNRRKNHK